MMCTITPATTQEKKPSELICIAVFLALYVLTFVFRVPRLIFEGQTLIWIQVSIYGLLGISGVFLFYQTFVIGFIQWKTAPLTNILWLLATYVGGMFAMLLASLPAYMMGIEAPQNDANVLLAVQMLGLPQSILILGLAGPVVEEVIYRALLIKKRKIPLWVCIKKRKIPLWVCIILSSGLFALVHLHGLAHIDFVGIIPHFAAALVYAVVYAKTGNITLPLAVHVINNSLAVILLYGI